MMKKTQREGKSTEQISSIVPKTKGKGQKWGSKRWVADQRPYFFKIMYPGLCDEILRIPPHFMTHLMEDMSNTATLMCSSGRIWNIKLRRAEGRIYLQDGWKQFLKDNSLGDMEFLLFRYEGNMCFDVQIFKRNGCEKLEMPVTGKHQGVAVTQGKRKRGRPKKNPLGSLPPPRSCGDGPGQSHLQLQSEKFDPVQEGKGIIVKIEDTETDLSILEVDSDSESEMEEFENAENFQGKMTTGSHLPILKIDSHTRPCSSERLPSTDEVEDVEEEEQEEDVVVVDDDEEEDEQAEEVVVVDDDDDVVVVDDEEEEEEEDNNHRFQRIAESFASCFPYFQRRLERACVEEIFILTIPTSFSRSHLQNIKTRMVVRNLQGKTWEMNCIPSGGKHYLCGGWAAFVCDNNLKMGDICIFELVGQNELQANIFQA